MTDGKWQIEILTPDGAALHPSATMVELATTDGQIGVLPGHQRLITALEVGELVIYQGKYREVYLVGGGFAHILPGRLSVLAYSLDCATDSAAVQKCHTRRRELSGDSEGGATFDRADEQPVRQIRS